MPLQATSGAASYDAFGGGVAAVPNYIEECFSTTLYTGNGSTQTITNGIDLSTKGGLVWIKGRDNASTQNNLYDTNRGIYKYLQSNTTDPQTTDVNRVTAFNSNGFSIGAGGGSINRSPDLYVSWTFREQPKFFDVVTYTGNGTTGRQIAHNLGSVPGCMIVKRTDVGGNDWAVYHRGISSPALYLNLTAANNPGDSQYVWGNGSTTVDPTSTVFTVAASSMVNANGGTYVAYLFAHNAGGFGLTGTDNVISCGSYTTDGSANATINLGYEPQLLLLKPSSAAGNWELIDNMRGIPTGSQSKALLPNSSAAEANGTNINLLATGFKQDASGSASTTYIYIAIRRGPMKVPTRGTSVFSPVTYAGDGAAARLITHGFPVDAYIQATTAGSSSQEHIMVDRLRGWDSGTALNTELNTASTAAEADYSNEQLDNNVGVVWTVAGGATNLSGRNYVNYAFRRSPSFFDEVCYTGTGTAQNITHNLGVAPELMIVKNRTGVSEWTTYQAPLGASQVMRLNSTIAAFTDASVWNGTSPTSSVFSVGTSARSNDAGSKFVIYLFATCAGVSKVFSYTGNGSSQTINCNFTGGARFVLIKRTDNTGDWYVWDSARGIVSGNDPHLSLNTTVAEVTTDDTIDTDSTGFVVNQVSATNVNVSSATYIGIAIA